MKHLLPELPYSFDALEPFVDELTLRRHYEVYHKGHIDRLNAAEKNLKEARMRGDYEAVVHWKMEISFYGSSHLLHSLFWENLSPEGGGEPFGAVAERIVQDFDSLEGFKRQFEAAAMAVEGSGWTILVWNPIFEQLEILPVSGNQDLTQWGVIPLLVLDLWEHAYCSRYCHNRREWIKAWWNVVNWEMVNCHYKLAANLNSLAANFQ